MSRPDPSAATSVVVLDTNVFVGGGFNPGSASAEMIAAIREGRLRMVWSDATRAETRRILEKIPPLSWTSVEDVFRPDDRVEVALDAPWLSEIPDPEDRKFAALAAQTGAILVSSDRHLLEHASAFDVRTPGRWWQENHAAGPEDG